jgi:hypothetical protein
MSRFSGPGSALDASSLGQYIGSACFALSLVPRKVNTSLKSYARKNWVNFIQSQSYVLIDVYCTSYQGSHQRKTAETP